jgi:hypothetical protein
MIVERIGEKYGAPRTSAKPRVHQGADPILGNGLRFDYAAVQALARSSVLPLVSPVLWA